MDKQNNLKVCHLINSLGDGGAEAVLYRLCTHDKATKHVVFSLMDGGKYTLLLEAAGIKVYGMGMMRGRITIKGLVRLWRMFRSEQPDLVQTWLYHSDFVGGLVARLSGVRVVCWGLRNSNLDSRKSSKSTLLVVRLCAWLSHWIPNAIVSCSSQAAVLHQTLGYDKSKFTVIPNGYNLAEFKIDPDARNQLRDTLGIAEQTILLGMAARYDPQKDHANLLKALQLIKEKHDDFKCLLVGAEIDSANQELQRLIGNEHIAEHVMLLGERSDIPMVMNALDINVLSSSYGEAFPNVLAEAMACGTPCVSTDVGDASIIVGDTGWIVPCSNPELLANAILAAIAEKQDAKRWAVRKTNCRERVVLNYSLEQMVAQYHNVWQKQLNSVIPKQPLTYP